MVQCVWEQGWSDPGWETAASTTSGPEVEGSVRCAVWRAPPQAHPHPLHSLAALRRTSGPRGRVRVTWSPADTAAFLAHLTHILAPKLAAWETSPWEVHKRSFSYLHKHGVCLHNPRVQIHLSTQHVGQERKGWQGKEGAWGLNVSKNESPSGKRGGYCLRCAGEAYAWKGGAL